MHDMSPLAIRILLEGTFGFFKKLAWMVRGSLV